MNDAKPPRPSRRQIATSAAIGAALAAVVILISSGGDVSAMTFGDGVLYRYVAENLSAPESQITHDLSGHGTALRYGRIGLPALLWLASAGWIEAMPYAQPLLMIAAAAAVAGAARMLVPGSPMATVAPFLSVGLLASIAGGFAEPLAIAFALWAVVSVRSGRLGPAVVLLAVAMLTREHAVGVVAGLSAWLALQRRFRQAAMISIAVLPALGWHAMVAARFGFFPLADPFLTEQTNGAGPPFVALWDSVTQLPARSVAIIAVHVALTVVALLWWRRGDLAACAAVSALLLTTAGPHVWRYIGDGVRLGAFLQVFLVMALLDRMTKRSERSRATGALSG